MRHYGRSGGNSGSSVPQIVDFEPKLIINGCLVRNHKKLVPSSSRSILSVCRRYKEVRPACHRRKRCMQAHDTRRGFAALAKHGEKFHEARYRRCITYVARRAAQRREKAVPSCSFSVHKGQPLPRLPAGHTELKPAPSYKAAAAFQKRSPPWRAAPCRPTAAGRPGECAGRKSARRL